jgi:hypothetical protein
MGLSGTGNESNMYKGVSLRIKDKFKESCEATFDIVEKEIDNDHNGEIKDATRKITDELEDVLDTCLRDFLTGNLKDTLTPKHVNLLSAEKMEELCGLLVTVVARRWGESLDAAKGTSETKEEGWSLSAHAEKISQMFDELICSDEHAFEELFEIVENIGRFNEAATVKKPPTVTFIPVTPQNELAIENDIKDREKCAHDLLNRADALRVLYPDAILPTAIPCSNGKVPEWKDLYRVERTLGEFMRRK